MFNEVLDFTSLLIESTNVVEFRRLNNKGILINDKKITLIFTSTSFTYKDPFGKYMQNNSTNIKLDCYNISNLCDENTTCFSTLQKPAK